MESLGQSIVSTLNRVFSEYVKAVSEKYKLNNDELNQLLTDMLPGYKVNAITARKKAAPKKCKNEECNEMALKGGQYCAEHKGGKKAKKEKPKEKKEKPKKKEKHEEHGDDEHEEHGDEEHEEHEEHGDEEHEDDEKIEAHSPPPKSQRKVETPKDKKSDKPKIPARKSKSTKIPKTVSADDESDIAPDD